MSYNMPGVSMNIEVFGRGKVCPFQNIGDVQCFLDIFISYFLSQLCLAHIVGLFSPWSYFLYERIDVSRQINEINVKSISGRAKSSNSVGGSCYQYGRL